MERITRMAREKQEDWAQTMAKQLACHMKGMQQKGMVEGEQKWYTRAPIWQELYRRERKEAKAKDVLAGPVETDGNQRRGKKIVIKKDKKVKPTRKPEIKELWEFISNI